MAWLYLWPYCSAWKGTCGPTWSPFKRKQEYALGFISPAVQKMGGARCPAKPVAKQPLHHTQTLFNSNWKPTPWSANPPRTAENIALCTHWGQSHPRDAPQNQQRTLPQSKAEPSLIWPNPTSHCSSLAIFFFCDTIQPPCSLPLRLCSFSPST